MVERARYIQREFRFKVGCLEPKVRLLRFCSHTSIHISTDVTCLGVVIDSELKFALHIKRFAGRCFYQLRQLRSIRRSLGNDATKTLVNAFISSRVDYCNSVFNGTGASIFVQSSLFSTRPHASLLRSVSVTRLQQQFEMSCTGYRCNKDSTKNSAISSTNVFTMTDCRIYHQCVFVLVRLGAVAIFDQQPVVT